MPMTENIKIEIGKIPDSFLAIKEQGLKYLKNNSKLDTSAINILHRPWVAPFNWGLTLFKGVNPNWLNQFTKLTNKTIPDFYCEFLLSINGCFIYNLSLYGLTPSIYTKGTLDRSSLQCLDLTTANNNWINEYNVSQDLFYFGGRVYSPSENIGYFVEQNLTIKSIRKNGKEIQEWSDFKTFLIEEVTQAENMMKSEIPKGTELIIE
jgi:hypothetical protein